MTKPTRVAIQLDLAVQRLIQDAWSYQLKNQLSEATVSRKLFGDARVLSLLWGGHRSISVRRLIKAAERLRFLKETT